MNIQRGDVLKARFPHASGGPRATCARSCWPAPRPRRRRVLKLVSDENFDGDILRGHAWYFFRGRVTLASFWANISFRKGNSHARSSKNQSR